MTKQFASIKRAMTGATNDIEEMITADTAPDMQSYLREVLEIMDQARERVEMAQSYMDTVS